MVCLKKLRALVASAHDHVQDAQVKAFDGSDYSHISDECEKALAALQLALHNELGVAPPGYDADFVKEHGIDPNGAPCFCGECYPTPGSAPMLGMVAPSPEVVNLDGVPARLWAGITERGTPFRLAVHRTFTDADRAAEFERDFPILQQKEPPKAFERGASCSS